MGSPERPARPGATGPTVVDAVVSRSLAGPGWQLWRTPLRPTGDRTLPDRTVARAYGSVTVPGDIQAQAGIADPWIDTPEVTSLNHDEWLHVRTFEVERAEGDRVVLELDGVDYFCDVWVDGTWVGHHEGQFGTFELDVTEALAGGPGAVHELGTRRRGAARQPGGLEGGRDLFHLGQPAPRLAGFRLGAESCFRSSG